MSSTKQRRIQILLSHISDSQYTQLEHTPCMSYQPPEVISPPPTFSTRVMQHILEEHNQEDIEKLKRQLSQDPLFQHQIYSSLTIHEYRELVKKRLLKLGQLGVFQNFGVITKDAMMRFAAEMNIVGMFDHSLLVTISAHFGLFGTSILFLGTEYHYKRYFDSVKNLTKLGCFSLTELGHGSNARGIETEIIYKPDTEEFIVNTPCESAQKCLIGFSKFSQYTIVFGNLFVGDVNHGIHPIIVEVRDEFGNIKKGVTWIDDGEKMGVRGVDNGRFWFDHVRVPRENLLNRFGNVTKDGKYESPIKDPDMRFAVMMAPLTGGRVILASTSNNAAKAGLTTAIRYAFTRRAFSPSPKESEIPLIEYKLHQRRLLPYLAATYAMTFSGHKIYKLWVQHVVSGFKDLNLMKTIHVLSSGLKALHSWNMKYALQECREACGGQGFKSENLISELIVTHEANLTFEGDNHVLLIQVSKALLQDFIKGKKKGKFTGLLKHLFNPSVSKYRGPNDSKTLLSIEFQRKLFTIIQYDLLDRLQKKLEKLRKNGVGKFYAWNDCADISEAVAVAYIENEIISEFESKIKSIQQTDIKQVLTLLRQLYTLFIIDKNPMLLRNGYINSDTARNIHKLMIELCEKVKPHALHLVNSFAIPPVLLGKIAFNWIEHNSLKNAIQNNVNTLQ